MADSVAKAFSHRGNFFGPHARRSNNHAGTTPIGDGSISDSVGAHEDTSIGGHVVTPVLNVVDGGAQSAASEWHREVAKNRTTMRRAAYGEVCEVSDDGKRLIDENLQAEVASQTVNVGPRQTRFGPTTNRIFLREMSDVRSWPMKSCNVSIAS
jgi:hypothetical protein